MDLLIVFLIFVAVVIAIISYSDIPVFWLVYKMIQPYHKNRGQKEERKKSIDDIMKEIDKMESRSFEEFTADLLKKLGYQDIQVTPVSGDQGADVIATKDETKYAIQCKRYSHKLGNKPVQEANAGKFFYKCDVAVVLTNNYFTQGGKQAAAATGVLLWDRDKLQELIETADV